MNLSVNSDDIPEHIEDLSEAEILHHKKQAVRKEFENLEML
jgi:hypothetical protein